MSDSSNLHRNLAPVTEAAWEQIGEEAARTFKRHVAGRRVVDVAGPFGYSYSAHNLGRVPRSRHRTAGFGRSSGR